MLPETRFGKVFQKKIDIEIVSTLSTKNISVSRNISKNIEYWFKAELLQKFWGPFNSTKNYKFINLDC